MCIQIKYRALARYEDLFAHIVAAMRPHLLKITIKCLFLRI